MFDKTKIEGMPYAMDERFFRALATGEGVDTSQWSPEAIEARRGRVGAPEPGSVAVIPIHGPIDQRSGIFEAFGFCTSTETIEASLDRAMSDPNVSHIVLDVDSPGGSVFGIQELGEQIYAAGKLKPITAVANSFMASAAYWLASQATEIIVTPGGQVGSVGVIAMHVDVSRAMEAEGVKVEFITAGEFKAEGNPYEPLSDEAREAMQADVDEYYKVFVRGVARGRRTTQTDVRENFGKGRMLMASKAEKLGMVDRIDTFRNVVGEIVARESEGRRRNRAMAAKRAKAQVEVARARMRS